MLLPILLVHVNQFPSKLPKGCPTSRHHTFSSCNNVLTHENPSLAQAWVGILHLLVDKSSNCCCTL